MVSCMYAIPHRCTYVCTYAMCLHTHSTSIHACTSCQTQHVRKITHVRTPAHAHTNTHMLTHHTMCAHTHTITTMSAHTHKHTPGHVFTVRMDVHLKPLVVVELLPDGRLVLRPEHGPWLGRSSVVLLSIHHLSIVCKGPVRQREALVELGVRVDAKLREMMREAQWRSCVVRGIKWEPCPT